MGAASNQRGVDLTVNTFAQAFGFSLNLRGAEFVISVGLAILALAMLMIFGLPGRSGRAQPRRSRRLLYCLSGHSSQSPLPAATSAGRGAILVFAGCIAGCWRTASRTLTADGASRRAATPCHLASLTGSWRQPQIVLGPSTQGTRPASRG